MKLVDSFNKPASRKHTVVYDKQRTKVRTARARIARASNDIEKKPLLKELKEARSIMFKLPAKMQDDKKLKYIRYADDFIIAVKGSKEDCKEIKQKLSDFIANVLKMELSEEKTLITHSNDYARFLGYDVRVRRNNQVKASGKYTQRTLHNSVELSIPLDDKIMKFLFSKNIISQEQDGVIKPRRRTQLNNCTPLEIISTYNAEIRGICNYYSLASNFYKISYFSYLMEYSCLKTLAMKHKSSISKVIKKYKDGKGKWGIPYETKSGSKRRYIAKYSDCKDSKIFSDNIFHAENKYKLTKTTLEKRLIAKECELCGTTESKQYVLHHVNKVKNLKGKHHWEKIMIAKRRKTLAICVECHHKIHYCNKSTK